MIAINPYAPPRLDDLPPPPERRLRPLRALARWTLVCGLSAAPSFFWGCSLHHATEHISAMLCGVGLFILVYTAVECSSFYSRLIAAPYVRRTLLIGYGTRLLLSLLFPVGLTLDMFLGVISVSLVETALPSRYEADASRLTFAVVLMTTVVQGLLLNLVLAAYMALVFAIQWGLGQGRTTSGGGAGGS